MTFHETILQKLLDYREVNPNFNFLTRQRSGAGKRFESGHWFQGNDGYAFVGLINASGGSNRTRSVGISISPTTEGYSCYFEIVYNEEKDQNLIEAYQELSRKIGGVKQVGDTKYNLKIGNLTDNDFSALTDFLDKYYKLIINEFIEHGREKVVVTNDKFQKLIEKVNKYRLAKPNESTNTEQMPLSLNQILYGPPGTGKTFALQNDLFELFTISESSLSKDQYITNLVSDLTWWQTFAIALYDSGRTTVSDLMSHEIVKSKASLSSATNIRPIAWSRMQAHTVSECEYVNVTDRSEPALFVKEEDSRWRVVPELVENLYPEGIELLNKIKGYKNVENESVNNYEFVTFHQSFNYEDFVEGIKPILEEGSSSLDFEIKDGIFKTLCLKADKDRDNKYAIFIDEINRGNVSAIFGELITLIEEDKRLDATNEIKVKLPYSKKPFGIPPNLYIIGTMNTADRSVEALDSALRRRFSFIEMTPDPDIIATEGLADEGLVEGVDLVVLLRTINLRIEKLLDKDHMIGHSYFLKVETLKDLKEALGNKIIPLLQEYFFGDYGKIGLVLGSGFVKQNSDMSKKDIFAQFTDYDMGSLRERSIYRFENISEMADNDFKKALKNLLGVLISEE